MFENRRSAIGILILSVIVPMILAFPVSTAILISGCASASRLFEETSFELAVVENFAFTARVTILHTLKRLNPISQHVRKISPVSK